MDLRNVVQKQKRYSTYGWNDIHPETLGYLNTLSQGEIGILLGCDGKPVEKLDPTKKLNTVLEVRIGSEDNQYFFNATLISTNTTKEEVYCIKTFRTAAELPSFGNGNQNSLYVVKDENAIYRWDDDVEPHWVPITGQGSDWHEIERIEGGCSSSGSTVPEY